MMKCTHGRMKSCVHRGMISLMISLVTAIVSLPAMAESRSFYMALYFGNDPRATDLAWFYPSQDPQTRYQPERRAILDIGGIYRNDADPNYDFLAVISAYNYDWGRIAAVVIDEPYTDLTPNAGCPSASALAAIQERETKVAQAASVIASLAPKTRFWINFAADEIYALRHCSSAPEINRPYIQVVSIDDYDKAFACATPASVCLRHDYDWLLANKPHPDQQLALVPSTFQKVTPPYAMNAQAASSRLVENFQYADEMNSSNRNRPIVWLIAGFPADVVVDNTNDTYYGLAAPGSELIAATWGQRWSRKPWPWAAPLVLSLY